MHNVVFPEDSEPLAGRYRIISQLGAGGMGTAYRAWDERAGVPVVIKIPKKIFLEDPKFAERFHREIRLLQGLTHPRIVPIIDVGTHEGLPFVVMRFLPGGSLSNRRLRDDKGKVRPNPPGMLHLWLPAVAEALDYVHSQGVVHRDVKPANIFFNAFWGAYLGDFGIAKIVEESETFDKEHTLTATHMGIGTQEYMCPEQFTPKAVIDGRADQYALAVMVYEMLAGTRPFTGSMAHLIVEVTTHQAPSLEAHRRDLPVSIVEAVHRGLAKRPEERFATCRELASGILRGVSPIDDEPGVARLLCPRCSNILKLPTEAAGRKGSCPKCRTKMKVADDLGALWLLDEARRQRKSGSSTDAFQAKQDAGVVIEHTEDEAIEAFKPVSSTTPIRRGSGNGQSRLAMGGLCLFICLWLTTPVASIEILESVLRLVHRARILGYDIPLVFFSWCCVAGVVAFYTWALPSTSLPLRFFFLKPRILIAAVAGLGGLLGSPALTYFYIYCFDRLRIPWRFCIAGPIAAWIGLVVTGVVWLWPIGGRGTVLPRWFGNPTHGSRVCFAATLAVFALIIAHGIITSLPEPRGPVPLPTLVRSEEGTVAKSSIVAAGEEGESDYDERYYYERGTGRWLTESAPARYEYCAKPASWAEADALCRRMNGHLLVIETAAECEFVRRTFGHNATKKHAAVWTGGMRGGAAGNWSWIDTRKQVLWWAKYTPVDVAAIGADEVFAQKAGDRLALSLGDAGQLVVRSSKDKLPFICE